MADIEVDTKKGSISEEHAALPSQPVLVSRPPIEYTSFGALVKSVGRRFASVWTKRFFLSLLSGQLISFCITATSITTTELVNRGWALPTTQSFFLYFSLFVIYTPYTIYKYGLKGWAEMIFRDGWKYFILAACDVEGNFLVVKAYNYTDLLSCMLLDAWAIPSCMFFVYLYTRCKYHWTQILGVMVCVVGLGLTVASDHFTNKNWTPVSRGKGDAFMIAGATLYGFSNATEEFLVRRRPLYEVVGQLGLWGTIICGTQAASLEHAGMKTAVWNGATIGLLFAFTAAMLILYTLAPLLYRSASSVFYNLSLLSSDFYGLIFGLFLYHYAPFWLYFVGFSTVILGLIIYYWHTSPEEQVSHVETPKYVKRRLGEAQDDGKTAQDDGRKAQV